MQTATSIQCVPTQNPSKGSGLLRIPSTNLAPAPRIFQSSIIPKEKVWHLRWVYYRPLNTVSPYPPSPRCWRYWLGSCHGWWPCCSFTAIWDTSTWHLRKKNMLEKMDAFTGSCPALVHLLKQCQCHVPKFGTSTDSWIEASSRRWLTRQFAINFGNSNDKLRLMAEIRLASCGW